MFRSKQPVYDDDVRNGQQFYYGGTNKGQNIMRNDKDLPKDGGQIAPMWYLSQTPGAR